MTPTIPQPRPQYRQAVYGMIRSLVGQSNIIAIPRVFLRLADGNYEAAALLTQCVYWSDYATNDGWFYKTYDQWAEEIMLSEYHIRQATATWTNKGILETTRRKVAGRPLVHYRVNFEGIEQAMTALVMPDYEKIGQSDYEKIGQSDYEKIEQSSYRRLQVAEDDSTKPNGLVGGDAPSLAPIEAPLPGFDPLMGTRISDWPDGLDYRHIAALTEAGYRPDTVRAATVQELQQVKGIGPKAIQAITGLAPEQVTPPVPPAVKVVQQTIKMLPPRILWDDIDRKLGPDPDPVLIETAYKTWVGRGFNPANYGGWLLDWCVNGIPANKITKLPPPPNRKADNATGSNSPQPSDEELDSRIAEARQRLARIQSGS